MAVSESLDSATVARLVAVDPALAHLHSALSDAEQGPVPQPHDMVWTPGSGCRLARRRRSPDGQSTFDAVTVTADGWSRHDFRDDPALPGLRGAADESAVGALLAAVVGEPLGPVHIEPVRYRPGSRCVLRYTVTTQDAVRTYYGKVLTEGDFARSSPILTALNRDPRWTRLARPLAAVWPEQRTLVTEAAAGMSASAVLGDPDRAREDQASLAHRLGDLLAGVHELEGVPAPRWTAADQAAALRSSVGAAAAADPDLGRRLDELIDRLEARPPSPTAEVLSHGGFRAGQVVVGPDDTLALLDVDGLCLSDRGRDLGTALAQLVWRVVRRPSQTLPDPLEDALLAGYRARAGVASLEALTWWRAAGLLQVAVRRYRRLETADWPWVPLLVDVATRVVDQWESRPISVTGTDLLDVSTMSSLLAPLLGAPAAGPEPPTIESARRLSVAEGRRMVVGYTLRSAAGGTTTPVVAKVFAESAKARSLDDNLRLLSRGPFRRTGWRVPEPLGVIAAQRLVLFGQSTAAPLSDLAGPDAVLGVRRASEWLVRLHGSDVRLPRELSLPEEARSAVQWAALIGRRHPDLADRARALATAWVAAVPTTPPGRQVPIHKDFHAGHVLLGEEVCVIDLDEARQGDPTFDLAHFCTYLDAVDDGEDRSDLRAEFLEAYADATGWSDEGSYRPYCAYAWLKVAKQRAAGRGPFRPAPPALRRSYVARAIEAGERCLDR